MQRRLLRQQRTARDRAFEPRRLSHASASPVRGWRRTCLLFKFCVDWSIEGESRIEKLRLSYEGEGLEKISKIRSTSQKAKVDSYFTNSSPLVQKIAVANTGAQSSLAFDRDFVSCQSAGISTRDDCSRTDRGTGTRLIRFDVLKSAA